MTPTIWTPAMIKELRYLFPTTRVKQLAIHFCTTENSVYHICEKIGLRRLDVPFVKPENVKEIKMTASIKRHPAIYSNVNWYEETLNKYA